MKCLLKTVLLCGIFVSPAFCALSNTLLSGDVMLRLMDDQIGLTKKKGGDDSTRTNETYLNYVWNVKAMFTASEYLKFGFRLSNPGAAGGERVSTNEKDVGFQQIADTSDNLNKDSYKTGYRVISVPEAYFKWSTAAFSITGGIIPVQPTTLFNFIAYEGKNFVEVGRTTWNVLMNNSQQGMLLEYIALDNPPVALVNLQLLVATAADKPADTNTSAADNILKNDQWRFALQAPMDFLGKKLSVNPGMHLRTNAGRSKDGEEGRVSLSGGLSLGYKALPDLSLRAGYAGGAFDKRGLGLADSVASAPAAHLIEGGCTYNTPIGPLMLDGTFSSWKDRSIKPPFTKSPILFQQAFGDLKFGIMLKGLTIMPRFRLWFNFNDTDDRTKLHLRPELQFKAAFK